MILVPALATVVLLASAGAGGSSAGGTSPVDSLLAGCPSNADVAAIKRHSSARSSLCTPRGGLVDLGTLGGRFSSAVAMNAAGEVVGLSDTAPGTAGGASHAVLWEPAGPVARCVVPNVKGRTLAAAESAITKNRCRTGTIRRAYSTRVGKGRVISQHPSAGAKPPSGAPVEVVVSRGPRHRPQR